MAYAEKYTSSELMVATVARLITNDDVVVVGMGVPIIAGAVAQNTTAPDATFVYECGGVGPRNRRIPWTVSDGPTTDNALAAFTMYGTLGDLQRGRFTLAVLGGAEIDRYGNLNSSMMPGGDKFDNYQNPSLRLPGPGGATDLAIFAGRTIIMMKLEKGKFVDKVKFITSPGYLSGPGDREKLGYPGAGPQAVLTNKAIFKFDPATKEMYVSALFPGVTVEEVLEYFDWGIKVAPKLDEIEPPTEEQIKVMHAYDPQNLVIGRTGSIYDSFEVYHKFMKEAYMSMTVDLN
jgi:glutaconate CoA-transferase subunit B